MKYLKTYTGVTRGTYMGRDDGYPCVQYQFYKSMEEALMDYGTKEYEKYYKIEEMDSSEIESEKKKHKMSLLKRRLGIYRRS